MLYALDEKNRKIRPSKGAKAICPYCHEKVNAACGDINIHHRRHDNLLNCDPWHENETDWHRGWKECFPEAWREKIIIKNGEKHIADIETETGLILELQHSSISSQTIKIREKFYGQMWWLIDASNFSDNFSIKSQVKSKLRSLEESYNYHLNNSGDIEDSLEGYYDELKNEAKQKENKRLELEIAQNQINKCGDFLNEVEKTCQNLVDSQYLFGIFYDFKSEQISNIHDLDSKIEKIDNEINYNDKKIKLINSLPRVKIEAYEAYQEVSFDKVSSKSFQKCKIIKRESLHSFFPEVLSINSAIEFARFLYDKDKYILIINLSEDLRILSENSRKLNRKRQILIDQKKLFFDKLKIEVENWLSKEILEEEEKYAQLEDEIVHKSDLIKRIYDEIGEERKRLINESNLFTKKLKSERVKKRIQIMQSYKGQYSYYWKYRRKTWDFSEKPIFLDFTTHIFEIKSEDILQKLSINEFINKLKNWR